MSHTTRKVSAGGFALAMLLPLSASLHADGGHHGHGHQAAVGAVYTMSNAPEGNSVLVFDRAANGRLSPAGEFDTGGLGTGSGLGDQSAVIIDPAQRWLFVVNAGSDDVSVFAIEEDGLSLVDQVHSGGQVPISLTYAHDLLYVLNAGGSVGGADSISGFHVGADGSLTPIVGSTQALSAANTGPAQIAFNADGDVLVVTEKATNLIDTFVVDGDGVAGPAMSHASEGPTPFGFAFAKRDQVIVSEAAGGAADASSASSYRLGKDGSLEPISSTVPTTESAACWAVVTNDGRYVYTTNAASGTLSGYSIGFDGSLQLLDKNGVTGRTGKGSGPLDMVVSSDGRNLYTLNGASDQIGGFRLKADGGLASIKPNVDVPATALGLAIR
ncbi:MAG: beta-propeller fold lactonase family protein [Chromatiaceae bacterium]|nr:beta-propeller fold lactonase family protein [Chromatiaceae bacterium]